MNGGFGSLYYTDCRPGQGLQGHAGFQFQAATPGLAHEAMPVVQRWGLYEPPAVWLRARRPVEQFPHSLAHTRQHNIYTTSAGRYLGQEANGMRQGNQFTHAVVTRDAAAYGMIRPAQLWRAPWWAGQPAPTTELPALPAHPQPGLLDTETVRQRIRATEGERQLAALLTATQGLADPTNRQPIVLITEDPELAACWIAAATLLLPSAAALGVSFKVFVADAQYGQHDIIAVHPEWAGHWSGTGGDTGTVTFDLDTGAHSTIDPNESARFWVSQFLRPDIDDALDVIDAVELAAELTGGQPQTQADRLAAMTIAAGTPLESPKALRASAQWLATTSDQAIRIGRDALLEAISAASPPTDVLATIGVTADQRGWADASGQINAAWFMAELSEVLDATDAAAAFDLIGPHRPARSTGIGEAQHDHLEAACRDASPARMAALLKLAARHGVEPRAGNFRAAADRFARWWLEQPDPRYAPSQWPVPDSALDWVRDALHAWLTTEPRRAAQAIRNGWWQPLLPAATDPSSPLDSLVIRTAYDHQEPSKKPQLITTVLRRSQDSTHPQSPAGQAWQALFATPPPPDDALSFAEAALALDLPLPDLVLAHVCAAIEHNPASERALQIAAKLRDGGADLSIRVREALGRADDVHRWARELRARQPALDTAVLAQTLDDLSPRELALHSAAIAHALAMAPKQRSLDVLRRCTTGTTEAVYRELPSYWWLSGTERPTPEQLRTAAFTFLLITDANRTGQRTGRLAELERRFGLWAASLTKADRRAIDQAHSGAPLGKPWHDWVARNRPSRIRELLGLSTKTPPGPPHRKS